jgi:hypothetical protein
LSNDREVGLPTALVFPVKTGYRLSMRNFILSALMLASALSAPGFAAPAQPGAPIKTGLWQIQTEREANGQKLPDASDRMKDMSPERRARFEAMLKQRGVAAGGAGGTQVCYTREMLERSPWADQQGGCKVSFSHRDASSWKWHATCQQFATESDGEVVFQSRESYTVKVDSVSKMGGKVRNSRITMTAKWVSADCGAVKPLVPTP